MLTFAWRALLHLSQGGAELLMQTLVAHSKFFRFLPRERYLLQEQYEEANLRFLFTWLYFPVLLPHLENGHMWKREAMHRHHF